MKEHDTQSATRVQIPRSCSTYKISTGCLSDPDWRASDDGPLGWGHRDHDGVIFYRGKGTALVPEYDGAIRHRAYAELYLLLDTAVPQAPMSPRHAKAPELRLL